MKEIVIAENAPKAVGPYSQAVKANGFMFVSGQIPVNPATEQIDVTDATGQAKQILANLKSILDAEGLGFEDVVKTTMFMVDLSDFARVNEVYSEYFTGNFPARSTIQVAALPKGAKVEIEAIVALK